MKTVLFQKTKIIFTILFILSAFSISACGGSDSSSNGGSDSGTGSGSNNESIVFCEGGDSGNGAEQIASLICKRYTDCGHIPTCQECLDGLLITEDIGNNLGLDIPDTGTSLAHIITLIDAGSVSVDQNSLDNCLEDLSLFSCNKLNNYYDSSKPDDYGQIEALIPDEKESCFGVLY